MVRSVEIFPGFRSSTKYRVKNRPNPNVQWHALDTWRVLVWSLCVWALRHVRVHIIYLVYIVYIASSHPVPVAVSPPGAVLLLDGLGLQYFFKALKANFLGIFSFLTKQKTPNFAKAAHVLFSICVYEFKPPPHKKKTFSLESQFILYVDLPLRTHTWYTILYMSLHSNDT